MSRTRGTRLVFERELRERLRGRLAWVMALLMALLVVGLIVIPTLVGSSGRPTVGLVGPSAQALSPALSRAAAARQVDLRLVEVADEDTARSGLEDGSLDAALILEQAGSVVEVKSELDPALAAVLQAAVTEDHLRSVLDQAGVDPATVSAALEPVSLSVTVLQPPSADRGPRAVAALGAGVLLYLSLGMYAGAVAAGVAQEKTSRTAEVLLGSVRPRQLLNGKVLGIGVLALGQLGLAVGAGLVANAVVKAAEIPATVWALLPSVLGWFVLGFAWYAYAMAAAGALVARQEEVQFVSLPIGMPLVVGFLLTYVAIATPQALWIRVVSFLPPLAPVLMPVRLALGGMAAWEMPLGVAVMAASIYGMVRLAARVYRAGLVRGGARLGWREAWRLGGE
jgi:ABC-2 type transport system permease protein